MSVGKQAGKTIIVEQTGSPIRRQSSQRATLIGMKLNKIGRVSELPDTPEVRGMITKVSHLVQIVDDVDRRRHYSAGEYFNQELTTEAKKGISSPGSAAAVHVVQKAPGEKSAWDVLQILAGLQDTRSEQRKEALWEATKLVCAFERSRQMPKSSRLQIAGVPRRMLDALFDHDASVAERAAYALVASSKSFSRGRNPARFEDLGEQELDQIRNDLEHLLAKLGDRFYSYVTIEEAKYAKDGSLDASVKVRLSRRLPVKVNEKNVIIPGPPANEEADIVVTSLPTASTKVQKRLTKKDRDWEDGDLFLAYCDVHVPAKEAAKLSELPFAFAVSGIGADQFELPIPAAR